MEIASVNNYQKREMKMSKEKRLKNLHKHYYFLIEKMKTAKTDKQFEKARGIFQVVKNEIIEIQAKS